MRGLCFAEFILSVSHLKTSCVAKHGSPYMGEASSVNSVGGKWLSDKLLQKSLTITGVKKGGGMPKVFGPKFCKLLEINKRFFSGSNWRSACEGKWDQD